MTNLRTILTGLAVILATAGCGSKTTSGGADTNTNWLKSCVFDADCKSNLSCLCGVCSETCDSNSSCSELSADAVCRTEKTACGSKAVSLCAEEDTKLGGNNPPGGGGGGGSNGDPEDAGNSTGGTGPLPATDAGVDAGAVEPADAGAAIDGGAGGSGGASGSGGAGGAPAEECPIPAGAAFPAAAYEAPATCSLPFGSDLDTLITNETDFQTAFQCLVGTPSGIDFSTRQLYVALARERTSAAFSYAKITPGGDVVVGLTSPAYCGGAAPPNTPVAVVMDKSLRPPMTNLCTTGKCSGLPVP